MDSLYHITVLIIPDQFKYIHKDEWVRKSCLFFPKIILRTVKIEKCCGDRPGANVPFNFPVEGTICLILSTMTL